MSPFLPLYIIAGVFGVVFLISLLRSIRIISAKSAYIVERLGKYSSTKEAGFHILIPFIDKVKYKHSLKEVAVDVPAQECFTQDNVKVSVDGVLYLKVVEPRKASYGIDDYEYATIQLAQTTMRSVIGKLELDKSFEERDQINATVVQSVDEASDPWGIKVSRYEIQNINVPQPILESMEVQMRAEREKRAEIARSLGEKESKINFSQASMEEAINISEGEKEKRINEAEGKAKEILAIARATAVSIRKIASAMQAEGGKEAVSLQVKQNYITQLNKLASKDTKLILPMDLTNLDEIFESINNTLNSD
jgi:regulator of protease activity HflC (stomatin/prohibitin superfamily)